MICKILYGAEEIKRFQFMIRIQFSASHSLVARYVDGSASAKTNAKCWVK